MSIPTPTAWEVLQAMVAYWEDTGYAGVVALNPKWNIETEEWVGLVRSGANYHGTIWQIGPAERTAQGRDLIERRTYVGSFVCGPYGYVPELPEDHGATTTEEYVSLALDALARAIHDHPRLGFGAGDGESPTPHATYPNATVRHTGIQEPIGQVPQQLGTANVFNVAFEIEVQKKLC
jgi:hypothetical protein